MKKSTIFGAYDNFYLYYFMYFIYKFWDKNYFAEFTMKIFYVIHYNTVYKVIEMFCMTTTAAHFCVIL